MYLGKNMYIGMTLPYISRMYEPYSVHMHVSTKARQRGIKIGMLTRFSYARKMCPQVTFYNS